MSYLTGEKKLMVASNRVIGKGNLMDRDSKYQKLNECLKINYINILNVHLTP